MTSNHLLGMLSGGDLRSDGLSNEVADIVLANDALFDDLFDGLVEENDVVRGRASDALEKIARSQPDLFVNRLPELVSAGKTDAVAMVRWHMAMILGHLLGCEEAVDSIYSGLRAMLHDSSVFTRSWVIVSLTMTGRLYPEFVDEITMIISELQWDGSAAIRTRVRTALAVLADSSLPFPSGWNKSEHILL